MALLTDEHMTWVGRPEPAVTVEVNRRDIQKYATATEMGQRCGRRLVKRGAGDRYVVTVVIAGGRDGSGPDEPDSGDGHATADGQDGSSLHGCSFGRGIS